MAVFLVRILLVIAILLLVRRIMSLLTARPQQGGQIRNGNASRQEAATDTVRDPVCGMYMDRRLALRLEKGKGAFFFCSKECREKFLSESK
jgi:uncharacterized protein